MFVQSDAAVCLFDFTGKVIKYSTCGGWGCQPTVQCLTFQIQLGLCWLLWWAKKCSKNPKMHKRRLHMHKGTREALNESTGDRRWCISALPLNENWWNYTGIDLVASSEGVFFANLAGFSG